MVAGDGFGRWWRLGASRLVAVGTTATTVHGGSSTVELFYGDSSLIDQTELLECRGFQVYLCVISSTSRTRSDSCDLSNLGTLYVRRHCYSVNQESHSKLC